MMKLAAIAPRERFENKSVLIIKLFTLTLSFLIKEFKMQRSIANNISKQILKVPGFVR